MDDDEELESGFLWWMCSWMATMIGVVVFFSFLWLNRNPPPVDERLKNRSLCGSPNCVRCQSLADDSNHHAKRLERFNAFFDGTSSSDSYLEAKDQIFCLFMSVENKAEILSSIYTESGYEHILKEEGVESLPHVWMLPGLSRHPFWDANIHKSLHKVVSLFEDDENLKGIQRDFRSILMADEGWKINSIPSGKWKVYHLCDQGENVLANSSRCSFTSQLLESVPQFMNNHLFGSAMFSVLEPGSSIEPHTGPCNYRLRCHVPLEVPPGYRIRVGIDISSWEEGRVMIFDDSFVHEVWQEGVKDAHHEITLASSGGRAVLIFDIWHPHVTKAEKDALEYIFHPTL